MAVPQIQPESVVTRKFCPSTLSFSLLVYTYVHVCVCSYTHAHVCTCTHAQILYPHQRLGSRPGLISNSQERNLQLAHLENPCRIGQAGRALCSKRSAGFGFCSWLVSCGPTLSRNRLLLGISVQKSVLHIRNPHVAAKHQDKDPCSAAASSSQQPHLKSNPP